MTDETSGRIPARTESRGCMTAKEYLRQARGLKLDIERKQNQLLELRALSERTTRSYEALGVGGTRGRGELEEAVVKLAVLSESLGRDLAEYAEKYRQISAVIDAAENPVFRRLLSLRYLEHKTWPEIAEELGYSCYHVVHDLHPKALRSFPAVVPAASITHCGAAAQEAPESKKPPCA